MGRKGLLRLNPRRLDGACLLVRHRWEHAKQTSNQNFFDGGYSDV